MTKTETAAKPESKMDKGIAFIKGNLDAYGCPICGTRMKIIKSGRLFCKKEHAFDVSKKGYVNFLNETKKNNYDKELFYNRKEIFRQGFYTPVAEEIYRIIKEYREERELSSLRLLDAGCGEGYYSNFLAEKSWIHVFPLDLSKEAISMATDYPEAAGWCIGDLSRTPFRDRSMDIILDVLTPANYKEFKRVLKNQGILIKVIPGDDYLKELRMAAKDQLVHQNYSNQETIAYAKEHMKISGSSSLNYHLPLGSEQILPFLKMTPMLSHINLTEMDLSSVKEITISMDILWGKL